jgi:hypothetical protein
MKVTAWFRKNGRYPTNAETKKACVLDVFLVQRHTLDRQFLNVEDWIRVGSAADYIYKSNPVI